MKVLVDANVIFDVYEQRSRIMPPACKSAGSCGGVRSRPPWPATLLPTDVIFMAGRFQNL